MREETRAYLKKNAPKIGAYVVSTVILVIILSVAGVTLSKKFTKVSHKGEMTIHTGPLKSDSAADVISQLGRSGTGIHTSLRTNHNNVWSIVFQRDKLEYVEKILRESDIQYSVVIEDMQSLIDQQEEEIRRRKILHSGGTFDFENFHPYEEVRSFLVQLDRENDLVQVASLGKTHEGRDILLATVSTNREAKKPAVFVDCNVHAREWITTAVCLWMLNELSTRNRKDPESSSLLESYDWLIKPIANPDGYAYTWDKDRLWMKNRFPAVCTDCYGIDLNRNFDADSSVGSSAGNTGSLSDPCSDFYLGSEPFSEPETRATRDILEQQKDRLKLALFLHSGVPAWLSPGAVNTTEPALYEKNQLMMEATTAIEATSGAQYYHGPIDEVLSGSSKRAVHYSYGKMNIVHSYLIQLPDGGSYSFMLAPTRIVPIATETWNGIKAALNVLKN